MFNCFEGSKTVVGRTQKMDKREQLSIKVQVKGTKNYLSAEIQDSSCLPQSLLLESDSKTQFYGYEEPDNGLHSGILKEREPDVLLF